MVLFTSFYCYEFFKVSLVKQHYFITTKYSIDIDAVTMKIWQMFWNNKLTTKAETKCIPFLYL